MDDYVIQFEEFEGFTGFDDAALAEIFKELKSCHTAMAWRISP
jgi:hypothetical protein